MNLQLVAAAALRVAAWLDRDLVAIWAGATVLHRQAETGRLLDNLGCKSEW
jgi:hypothetical protein